MPNDPIRQHWVPKAYLRAFCVPPVEREQIFAYNLADGRAFKTSITNVAVMRHFYTLGLGQGQASYAVENALSCVGSDVKPVLTQMIETEELVPDGDLRMVFASFLGTLFMRTRQGLQIVHGHREDVRAGGSTLEYQLSPSYAENVLNLDDEGMRELFAKAVIVVGSKLATVFDAMHWRLLRATEDYFLASENPLVVYHATEEPWGLGTPGVHIHLPLSPNLVLHISKEPVINGEGTFNLSAAGVQGLNGLTVLGAEQYLFSHTGFDEVRSLLDDRPSGSRREFGPQAGRGL